MIRKGHHNGSPYWYCKTCNRYSGSRKKPSQEAIFNRYSQGTFTIKELSQDFTRSSRNSNLPKFGLILFSKKNIAVH